MSIFGNIMGAIFGHAQAQPTQPPPGAIPPAAKPQTPSAPTPAQAAPPANVDVAAVLEKLKAQKSQNLDWQHSIVDLMKLLDLDSSLAARKELASELHYSGSTDDSASMNIWLHKQVMVKLSENGGKVPESLKH